MNNAISFLGYCSTHDNNIKALYDKCVSLASTRALEYCREFDRVIKGLEYVVRLLVQPSGKVKVGLTRKTRLLERISEQQHIAATVIDIVDKLYEVRLLELELSKHKLLSDKGVRQYITCNSTNVSQALYKLKNIIEDLNIQVSEQFKVIRIIPPRYNVRGGYKYDGIVVLLDYWGGYVLSPEHSR